MAMLVENPMPLAAQPHALDALAMSANLRNNSIALLESMFPSIERDILAQMLDAYNGDATSLIDELLAAALAGEDNSQNAEDAEIARRLQLEADEQTAKALNARMQQQQQRAEAATAARATAGAALGHAGSRAKAILARVRAARNAKRPAAEVAGRVSLLDHDGPPVDVSEEDFRPVTPLTAGYEPPPAAAAPVPTYAHVHVDTAAGATFSDAVLASALQTKERVSSRLERARSANKLKGRSLSVASVEAPTSAAPLSAAGPVDLI